MHRQLVTAVSTSWLTGETDPRYLRLNSGTPAIMTAAPAALADVLRSSIDIRPRTKYGLFVKTKFLITSGTGAWSNCNLSAGSAIVAVAAPSRDLIIWPTAQNIGQNACLPAIGLAGNATHYGHNAPLPQGIVGPASVASGSEYAGLVTFSSNYYNSDFRPFEALAWFLILDPATAPSSQTYQITVEVWEVWD